MNMKPLDRGFIQKLLLLFLLQVVAFLLHTNREICQWQAASYEMTVTKVMTAPASLEEPDRCAVNLFGLPRSFRSLTLPSLVKNVIALNADCDYFVHYYQVTHEAAGRSGAGGTIDSDEILLLREAVRQASVARNESRMPIVEFTSETEDEFGAKYQTLLTDIETNQSLYVPWNDPAFKLLPTTINIVKMWHSIQSVHQLMEQRSSSGGVQYTSVAMLRSDVVYITPLNLRDHGDSHDMMLKDNTTRFSSSNVVTIPAFGQWPVSDRLVYGYPPAVKVWATQRLSRLQAHVLHGQIHAPGTGMHSEKFLARTIFPLLQRVLNVTIRTHPTLCFVRARADGTVWVADCERPVDKVAPSIAQSMVGDSARAALEIAIGRTCHGPIQAARFLNCSLGTETRSHISSNYH
jgi:hypothetical protein